MKVSGYKVSFINICSSAHVQWGKAALHRQALQWITKCINRQHGPPRKAKHSFWPLEIIKLSDARYWEWRSEYPRNTVLWNLETRLNRRCLFQVDNTFLANSSSHSKQNTTTTRALPGQGFHFRTEANPPLPRLFSNSEKMEDAQERRAVLDNSFTSFCHLWTRCQGCPKSTSASSKARASKTDRRSPHHPLDSKKDWAVLELRTTRGLR